MKIDQKRIDMNPNAFLSIISLHTMLTDDSSEVRSDEKSLNMSKIANISKKNR